MTVEGVARNGRNELAEQLNVPDGIGVRVDVTAKWSFEPCDPKTELTIRRQSIEGNKAGRGTQARAFLRQLAIGLDSLLRPGE